MATDAEYRARLTAQGVTPPAGSPILDVRWKARFADWYALVGETWHWWDPRASEWKPCTYAPD